VRRGFRRGLAMGALSGLVAVVVAEAIRPRGGSTLLLDWDQVMRLAENGLREERLPPDRLASVAAAYNGLATELREPLLETLGGLPAGVRLPDFQALDRAGWLELNVGIMRRVMEPLAAVTQVPESWLAVAGRAGLNRYVALMLVYLGRRVLGQFDPQLLGREPVQSALYLVEPNVAEWQRQGDLDGDDLRRWLILHEMTHAWQFAGHPWLREHLDSQIDSLISLAVRSAGGGGIKRLRAVAVGAPSQWDLVRRMQATMSLVEGHGNLVMGLVGKRLPTYGRLEAAYRRRSGERGPLERLLWRVTGLEMKMEQYRTGERFARAVHDRYGMDVLNRAWDGPESLPRLEELGAPDRWYRRVVRASAAR
jgi:coenzyme F420 biosynthesis associated uncharacterized protein